MTSLEAPSPHLAPVTVTPAVYRFHVRGRHTPALTAGELSSFDAGEVRAAITAGIPFPSGAYQVDVVRVPDGFDASVLIPNVVSGVRGRTQQEIRTNLLGLNDTRRTRGLSLLAWVQVDPNPVDVVAAVVAGRFADIAPKAPGAPVTDIHLGDAVEGLPVRGSHAHRNDDTHLVTISGPDSARRG